MWAEPSGSASSSHRSRGKHPSVHKGGLPCRLLLGVPPNGCIREGSLHGCRVGVHRPQESNGWATVGYGTASKGRGFAG